MAIDFNKLMENNKTEDNRFYLLIAGTRYYENYIEFSKILDKALSRVVSEGKEIIIVSGGANGADRLAEKYAKEREYQTRIIEANWSLGKSAGYKRNEQMHEYIAAHTHSERGCICFWDGKSRGTRHNFFLVKEYNTPLYVYYYTEKRFLTKEEIEKIQDVLLEENKKYRRY